MSLESPSKKHRQDQHDHTSQLTQVADQILPYLTPIELANISATCKHLHKTSQHITQHRRVDASRGLENTLIAFINNTKTQQPPYAYFLYTSTSLPRSSSLHRQFWGPVCHVGFGNGEDHDGCDTGCPCLVADDAGLVAGVATECGPHCGLARGGVKVKLKVVWDARKGWCLFADQGIRRGQFVCEYAGEFLTTEEARRRQQLYDELASSGGFSSALLVIREHLPSRKACFRINIDATRVGNVARFINHSCDGGNLSTVLVRSSGALLPRLCFFASRDIQKDEELTFSYGDVRVRSKGLQCLCGSSCCLGTLPSEHT